MDSIAAVIVPGDPSNGGRACACQTQGFIKLQPEAGPHHTNATAN